MKGLKKAMVSCTFDSTSLAQLRESVRARETGYGHRGNEEEVLAGPWTSAEKVP